MIGIYSITNVLTGMVYVGQSLNISHRFSRHKGDLKYSRHFNEYIQNSYNKYGIDIFRFETLLGCSEDELDTHERYFIDKYQALGLSYNFETGGRIGKQVSSTTRKKISLAHTGKIVSDITRERLSNALKGRPSPMKGCVSSMKGKKHTDESRQHMSDGAKGRTANNKGKPSPLKGIRKSEETRKRMSEAKKLYYSKVKEIL